MWFILLSFFRRVITVFIKYEGILIYYEARKFLGLDVSRCRARVVSDTDTQLH